MGCNECLCTNGRSLSSNSPSPTVSQGKEAQILLETENTEQINNDTKQTSRNHKSNHNKQKKREQSNSSPLSVEEDSEEITSAKAGAAWLTLSALTEVNRPEEIDWKSIPSMQTIAWKTGTSYGFRDAWAVGVTPRYAVGVWVGNATGEGKPGLVGAQTAGPVLFDIFSYLPSSSWFERPTGVFVDAEICRQSGHLKGRFCEETDTVLILPAGLRTEACPYHHLVTLSADESHRIYETVQIPNLPFRNHGLPCHLYGNGTISSTIRNTSHCHLSKPAVEKILSNPCSSSTSDERPYQVAQTIGRQ